MEITIKYEDLPITRKKFTWLDCPFVEEDSDTNEILCFLKPGVNERCNGHMKNGCPIIKIKQ